MERETREGGSHPEGDFSCEDSWIDQENLIYEQTAPPQQQEKQLSQF